VEDVIRDWTIFTAAQVKMPLILGYFEISSSKPLISSFWNHKDKIAILMRSTE